MKKFTLISIQFSLVLRHCHEEHAEDDSGPDPDVSDTHQEI
jgi:hypothetical protein